MTVVITNRGKIIRVSRDITIEQFFEVLQTLNYEFALVATAHDDNVFLWKIEQNSENGHVVKFIN